MLATCATKFQGTLPKTHSLITNVVHRSLRRSKQRIASSGSENAPTTPLVTLAPSSQKTISTLLVFNKNRTSSTSHTIHKKDFSSKQSPPQETFSKEATLHSNIFHKPSNSKRLKLSEEATYTSSVSSIANNVHPVKRIHTNTKLAVPPSDTFLFVSSFAAAVPVVVAQDSGENEEKPSTLQTSSNEPASESVKTSNKITIVEQPSLYELYLEGDRSAGTKLGLLGVVLGFIHGSLLQQGIRSLVLAVCMETLVMYVFAGAGYIKLMWREKHPIIVKGWRAYLKKLELFFTQNIPVKIGFMAGLFIGYKY